MYSAQNKKRRDEKEQTNVSGRKKIIKIWKEKPAKKQNNKKKHNPETKQNKKVQKK